MRIACPEKAALCYFARSPVPLRIPRLCCLSWWSLFRVFHSQAPLALCAPLFRGLSISYLAVCGYCLRFCCGMRTFSFLPVVTFGDVDMSLDASSGVSFATEQKRSFELLRKWGYALNEVSGEGPMPDRILVPDKIVKVIFLSGGWSCVLVCAVCLRFLSPRPLSGSLRDLRRRSWNSG